MNKSTGNLRSVFLNGYGQILAPRELVEQYAAECDAYAKARPAPFPRKVLKRLVKLARQNVK